MLPCLQPHLLLPLTALVANHTPLVEVCVHNGLVLGQAEAELPLLQSEAYSSEARAAYCTS